MLWSPWMLLISFISHNGYDLNNSRARAVDPEKRCPWPHERDNNGKESGRAYGRSVFFLNFVRQKLERPRNTEPTKSIVIGSEGWKWLPTGNVAIYPLLDIIFNATTPVDIMFVCLHIFQIRIWVNENPTYY